MSVLRHGHWCGERVCTVPVRVPAVSLFVISQCCSWAGVLGTELDRFHLPDSAGVFAAMLAQAQASHTKAAAHADAGHVSAVDTAETTK